MGNVILEDDETIVRKIQCIRERAILHADRVFQPTACLGKFVVIENQCTIIAESIGVGKDFFIETAFGRVKVKEGELLNVRKQGAAVKEWEDAPVMPADQAVVGIFIQLRTAKFHAIFFRI